MLFEDVADDEQIHEVASWEVVHDEIEVVLVLEGVEQVDDPISPVC